MGQTEPNSQFSFADFCRFSLFLGIIAFRRRRFSQKTAGNRRFSQKPVCPIEFVPFSSARLSGHDLLSPFQWLCILHGAQEIANTIVFVQRDHENSETGIGGGVKTYRTLEGEGGTRPESCPSKTWTFGPKLAIFYRISVERGQF